MPSPEGIGLGGGGVGVGGALLLKQGLPASRAGGVGDKPRVNAPDVEPVVTVGQNPDSLAFLELTEADGAVRVEDLDRGGRSVGRDGDLPQCALLQPRGGQPRRGLVRRLERKPPRAPQRAPHDRVQPQRAYQRAQQRRQDYHHVRVEVRLARQCPARAATTRVYTTTFITSTSTITTTTSINGLRSCWSHFWRNSRTGFFFFGEDQKKRQSKVLRKLAREFVVPGLLSTESDDEGDGEEGIHSQRLKFCGLNLIHSCYVMFWICV